MASDTSVLIVEHREVLRRGLEAMVGSFPQVDRCHCLAALDEVERLADGAGGASRTERFDVSIASVEVYATSSVNGGSPLLARHSIALIESSSPHALEAAAQTRADGYLLLADMTAENLRTTVDDVLAGQALVPQVLSAHLLERARRPDSLFASRSIRLSPREAEVVELVVAGLSNKEIARQLDISIHGAKRHVSSVLNKFNAPSRSYLISQMLRLGLARPHLHQLGGRPGNDHE